VNTVAPGFIPVERHADVPDDVKQAYLASVPAGRMELLATSPTP
jgi:3-oxoacyl-[acyl-carrier protein] reductase